jgi:hypothetical protein
MTIGQSRSRGKIGKSDKRNTSSIVPSDEQMSVASLANRILPWDFSSKVTNNITRFHNHRNNESARPNLLNTDQQRPKYINDAKLNNRNKHSVSYIKIRHATWHNTPSLTTLSHDPLSHNHHPHNVYNSSIVNYKLKIRHRADLHHRQQPVIQQQKSNKGIKLGHDPDSRS